MLIDYLPIAIMLVLATVLGFLVIILGRFSAQAPNQKKISAL
jgi:NADH:ubiquinone oxidoreductase subunit 3 (subunit A)